MQTVLMAVDGTQRGLDMVSVLGRLLKDRKDIRIVLLHCVPQIAALLPEDLCMDIEESCKLPCDTQERVGQAVLKASSSRLTDTGFPGANIDLRMKLDSSDPARDIIDHADKEQIRTIVVGRRGRSQVEALLLGSISGKVAQYAHDKVVWVVDSPVNDSMKVLIAMERAPEVQALSHYTAQLFGPCTGLSYSFVHIIPPLPPEFWDDGHILDPAEQKERQDRIEKWRSEWTGAVDRCMSEGRDLLTEHGVDRQKVETMVLRTRQGIARDLLTEIEAHKFRIVVMGRKSFGEQKPFLLGSHASKILQNSKGVILCLVS